jgi:nucleoside-diphosphate-sugar epimerase
MHCLVTGAAGFIGSHLAERLVAEGHTVAGIDCFTPYYPRSVKDANLAMLRDHAAFRFHDCDLASDDLRAAVEGVQIVYHLAAMPGLVRSWTHFDDYQRCNLTATHRLLEALRPLKGLTRIVYASTSSVYGKYASGDETLPTKPSSPYGVTKLAGEHLLRTYGDAFDLPYTILRYFSVYGPRQRPEMGYHLFINAILKGTAIPLTGDGLQVRGNTFVADCVDATVRAATAMPGETFNLGGGELVTVLEVLRRLEAIIGKPANLDRKPARPGDQVATGADIAKLTRFTGWTPRTSLDEGLRQQVEWQSRMQS